MNEQCREIRGKFDRFFEGTLGRGDAGPIREHIASCKACRTAFEAECRLIDCLTTLPRLHCPRRVTDEILEKTKAGKRSISRPGFWSRWWSRPVWKPALAGFGVIVAALVLVRTIQKAPGDRIRYTAEEIRRADAALRWSMIFSAQTVQRSEQRAVEEVFTRRLPETIRQSVQTALPNFGGNQP